MAVDRDVVHRGLHTEIHMEVVLKVCFGALALDFGRGEDGI